MTELKSGKYEFYPNDDLQMSFEEMTVLNAESEDKEEIKLRNGLSSIPEIKESYSPDAEIVISSGDCVEILSKVPDEVVKLVITSPPYNIGKEYEKSVSLDNYLESLRPAIEQIIRVVTQDGSICWQVGNYVNGGEVFPLDIYFYSFLKEY